MYETVILEYEGRFGRGRKLDDIVEWVDTIPPIPEAANRALKLVDDPNSTPYEISGILSRDPGIVAAVMRAANSAALGRAETVTALEQAVLVVGFGALKSILFGLTLKRWNQKFGDIEKLVWEKSIGTASSAYVIATFLGKTYQDTARLCGLLHNLGQIIMLSNPQVRDDYTAVLQYIKDHHVDFCAAEREIIGFSHPLVGAMVARKWQLPFSICSTILHYSEPFDGIETPQDEQTALTKLAASLSMCAGMGCPSGHPLDCGVPPEDRDVATARCVAEVQGETVRPDCESLYPVARALGFKENTFANYRAILAKQALALYTTESNTFR